jgi:hypothetical protein
MNLETEIETLINSKREGTYWDFKEFPHDNNASLLHDILCLANANHNGNRYLIIGVSDPKDGCKIRGISEPQQFRKEQSGIVDFLRTKKFAGDVRPEVEIKALLIEGHEIDIIIILNRPYKPYFLTENYRDKDKKVFANHIYTRILDTNTPIDKSADIYNIEEMWYERFGLSLSPIERMKLLLKKPNEWFKDLGNKDYAYHKQFPEFRIEFSELEEIRESYSYLFTNHRAFLGEAKFKYHSTTLFELQFVTVDEMRIHIGGANPHCVDCKNARIYYFFYDVSSLDGIFHYFLTDGNFEKTARGDKNPFLFFSNEIEQSEFDNFLIKNIDTVLNYKPDALAKSAHEQMLRERNNFNPSPIQLTVIRQMYDKWIELKK